MHGADSKDEEVREEVEVVGSLTRRRKVGLSSESRETVKKMECLVRRVYFDQRNVNMGCRGEKQVVREWQLEVGQMKMEVVSTVMEEVVYAMAVGVEMGDLQKRLEATFQVDQKKKQETRTSMNYENKKKIKSKKRNYKLYFLYVISKIIFIHNY
jgi:regulator of replication initiation timing